MIREFTIGKELANKTTLIILLTLLLAISAFAQLSGKPERGFQAGNSYSISDIENINLNSGNVSTSIPLASLPKGRGTSPGFSISINYNSKLWNSEQQWETDALEATNTNPERRDYPRNLLVPAEDGGWKVRTSYELKLVYRLGASGIYPQRAEACFPFNTNYSKNGYAYKIEMQMPGGGVTSFRPYGTGSNYDDFHRDGFFKIDPNGKEHNWSLTTTVDDPDLGTSASCQYTSAQVTTSGMTYYATDGSNVRLFIPYDSGGSLTGGKNWKMYYPNGTIVENLPPSEPTISQKITDANGNKVKIKSDIHNGVGGIKIIDDLGRFIFYGGNKVIRSGANNEELETSLTWKTQWVYKNYKTVTPDFLTSIPQNKRYQDMNQSFQMLDELTLPTQTGGLSYKFKYHADDVNPLGLGGSGTYTDGWGELKQIELPTGAKSEYKYDLPTNENGLTTFQEILSNPIIQKDLIYDETYDGQSTPRKDTWLYEIDFGFAKITSPSGSVSTQSSYNKSPYLNEPQTWNQGLVHTNTNPDGSVTKKVWKHYEYLITQGTIRGRAMNAYVDSETTTIKDANGNDALTTKKEYEYDQNSNLLEVKEYNFIAAGQTNYQLKRKTVNTYYNQTQPMSSTTQDTNFYGNPNSPAMLNLVKSTEIQDGSGNPVSRTEFIYDNSTTTPTKGNLTETRVWDSTQQATLQSANSNGFRLGSNNSISTTATYDAFGNILTATDAKGTQSQITYGSVNGYTGLYPTETKSALGETEERTATATYDFNTGLVITTKDVDNNVETKTEYDDLGRPTKVVAAYNSSNEIWTRTEYDDVLRRVITRSDLEVKGDGKNVAIRHFDELGRARLARAIEDIASEDPTNEEDGIKVQTRYKYDDGANPASSNGVYSLSSNPYRATKSSLASNEETMGWTVNYAPKDGKYSTSESFSGASLPAPFGSNAASTGVVRTDIDANRTLVTDQAGKQRISKTNALGQLTDVWEIKASDSDTESVSFPSDSSITHAYKTSYSYDTLNNLTTVNQGQQSRTFTYNSLSRLKSAANPESGTISYIYDENGNLTSKTDARNITTTYLYDNINRVKTRSYNDGVTSTVNYIYDNKANAIGQLTKVSNGISTTEYQVFDKAGRVTQSQQTTDGETYNPITYKYNLSGAMTEQKYPSGRIVKNVLDNDGMLSMIQSKKNANSGYFSYAKSFRYNATGAVESMQLGNGKWESTTFNSRLQPTQIALGTVQNGTDKLKLDYEYNSSGQNDNNGNVLKQTITTPTTGGTAGFTAIQTYNYDELNRLKSAEEKISNVTSWKQTFTFDRYGNKQFDTGNDVDGDKTTTLDSNCGTAVCNPTIDPATNKLVGYTFDNAGNTKVDATGQIFTYDAENKQILVKDANGNTIGEYFYDGDGKRVKKKVGNDITIFVYNASGQVIADYATQISQPPKVSYLTSDHLGSPRITTDANGDIYTRRDFMPFGEEIDSSHTSERSVGLNYATDEIRQKFTTYERDNETELDFAQARMYASKLGRFTSSDPLYLEFRRLPYPQAWNIYTYARNNPHKFVDPSGLIVEVNCKGKEACGQAETDLNNRKGGQFKVEIKNGYYKVVGKVNFNKLTKSEQKLYTAITDNFGRAKLNVVASSDEITFGKADGKGENSVDLSDLTKLNETGDATLSGETIAHEIIEGYESSLDSFDDREDQNKEYTKSNLFKRSHKLANEAFGNVTVDVKNAPPGASGDNRQATYNFGRLGVSTTVTKKFATKVPLASINSANFAGAVGNVDKVVIKKDIPKQK